MKKTKYRMKVNYEKGTNWITVSGVAWSHNKQPVECIDKFGDVWLKPYRNAPNLYITVQGPELLFSVEDENLKQE